MDKYNIKFDKLWERWPNISVNNDKYRFVSYLASFNNQHQVLDSMIIDVQQYIKEGLPEYKEYISSGQSFIRIWADKVEFGQYDDNFFHEMEEFKDYVEEGEKIFGSIPTEDFLEIVKQWRDFIIQSENK